MEGGYINCHKASIANELTNFGKIVIDLQKQNQDNWYKLTGTTVLPKMLQLTWDDINNEYIPLEFTYTSDCKIFKKIEFNEKTLMERGEDIIPLLPDEDEDIEGPIDAKVLQYDGPYAYKDIHKIIKKHSKFCDKFGLYGYNKNKTESCETPCESYYFTLKNFGKDLCKIIDKDVIDKEKEDLLKLNIKSLLEKAKDLGFNEQGIKDKELEQKKQILIEFVLKQKIINKDIGRLDECYSCGGEWNDISVSNDNVFTFNLFEIMRQILVTQCLNNTDVPLISNPVTQKFFSLTELNSFTKLFKESVIKFKQNYNIENDTINGIPVRKYISKATNIVTYILTAGSITLYLLGSTFSPILGLFSAINFTIKGGQNIYNKIEIENQLNKNPNNLNVLKTFVETIILSSIYTIMAVDGIQHNFREDNFIGPLKFKTIMNNLIENANNIYNVEILNYEIPLDAILPFYDLAVDKLVSLRDKQLIDKLYASGNMTIYYKQYYENKSKFIINNYTTDFDLKLNQIIINEQEIRSKYLPINKDTISNLENHSHDSQSLLEEDICQIIKPNIEHADMDADISLREGIMDGSGNMKINKLQKGKGKRQIKYEFIIDPKNGKKFNINSKKGRTILKKYMIYL